MQATRPQPVDLMRTVPVSGSQGETVRGRFLEGTIRSVRFARSLAVERNGERRIFSTGGLWAVVDVRLEATTKAVSVYRRVWISGSGVTFDESRRLPSGLPMDFAAGDESEGQLIFEVAADQAMSATLVLSRDWITEFDNELRIRFDKVPVGPDRQPIVIETLELNDTGGGTR